MTASASNLSAEWFSAVRVADDSRGVALGDARIQQDHLNIVHEVTITRHEVPLIAADDRAILHGTSRWSEGR
jgi:hypothetical protein